MVIQSNMSPKAILQVWENTIDTFYKFGIPVSERKLEDLADESVLPSLIKELNTVVGSSNETCIGGG